MSETRPIAAGLSDEALLDMYRQMQRIRVFEQTVLGLHRARADQRRPAPLPGRGGGRGGRVCSACAPGDYITSTHRGHGHCIAKGGQFKPMMAELFGKATGYCKGKGGSMHIADIDLGILGANGIVGGGLPIAVGAALSSQLKRSRLGRGGLLRRRRLQQGRLPRVAQPGRGLEAAGRLRLREQPVRHVHADVRLHADPGHRRCGPRATACRGSSWTATTCWRCTSGRGRPWTRGRAGRGPTLIECKTYRHIGHFVGDTESYRSAEETRALEAEDPIPRFRQMLDGAGSAGRGGRARAAWRRSSARPKRRWRSPSTARSPSSPSCCRTSIRPSRRWEGGSDGDQRNHLRASVQRGAGGRDGARPGGVHHGRGRRLALRAWGAAPWADHGAAGAFRGRAGAQHAHFARRPSSGRRWGRP